MTATGQYEPYRVYLADVSYFSGKLEAFLRYKQIPYERIEAGVPELINHVYTHTGLMKVPVVECATGQWLKDTTPMLYWFDQHYPQASIIPTDPATHLLSRLVEDYADEWLWRPALYYRWMYRQDFRLLGDRIAREVMGAWPLPKWIVGRYFGYRQIAVHLKGDGMRGHNREHIESIYLNNIDNLQKILEKTPYLLGSHPTLIDFGYFASMFRHFGLDPTPARIMRQRAPAVYEWLARLWNAQYSHLPDKQQLGDFSHPGWDWILGDIAGVYLPYLQANAQAWTQRRKRFDYACAEAHYPALPVSQYRVWCLGELQRAYTQLSDEHRRQVGARLGDNAVTVLGSVPVTSGLEQEFVLPLRHKPRPARGLRRLKLFLQGTPQDMPAAED